MYNRNNMKKNITFILLLMISVTTFSQQTSNNAAAGTKPDYLKRSKNQQKIATIVLLSGPVLIVSPLIFAGLKLRGDAGDIAYYAMIAGFLTLPASITIFIIASGNQKKAVKLGFRNEKIPLLTSQAFTYHSVPSLTLKISL